MNRSRFSLLTRAFADRPLTVAGKQLRPMTAGSLAFLLETGNPLFTTPDPEPRFDAGGVSAPVPELSDVQALDALFEFIWIHTAPIPEVIRLTGSGDGIELKQASRALGLEIGIDDLDEFKIQFEELNRTIRAALTEVVDAKESEAPGKSPATIPTGSPHGSLTSVVPPMPSASTGSCGDSHLPAGCNISTPPASTTAEPPAGSMM